MSNPTRRKLTKQEREYVYQKMNGHCAYCGCELELKDMQADHVQPLRREGADCLENLLPACRSCNRYKSVYTPEEFREQLGLLHSRMQRDSSNYSLMLRFGIISANESPIEFYFERLIKKGGASE